MRLLCALGLFLALLHVTSCLLIGAFNIQCFGDRKSQDNVVMNIIKEIVLRYDIILIQEVRCNHDLSVPHRLLALVNQDSPQFSYIVSEPLPLGPDTRKERYLFLYRHQKVAVTGCFQYDEGKRGVFDRPPFVVQFSSTETDVEEFVLIPIHTSPLTAAQAAKEGKISTVEQLNALVDVVEEAKLKWTNDNIMVLGDFNAGSRYVGDDDWKNIRLRANTNFHWLIDDNVDTTMAEKPIQAHDRIVVTTEMEKGVVAGSAAVFDFIKAYSPKEAKKVSDHFPVEVEVAPPKTGQKRPHSDDSSKTPKKSKP
ncbi:Deoxyribonuclease-1 [Dissostichus eleginoides]|uniref:Deoxyribonuclease n=1 Tax=Dissostichus eleginoides TaxID=100907 RepID=A0AAD9B8U6_DISEL|nr:Deoxyribonuclease-1 [Dissostichus eleginoides]